MDKNPDTTEDRLKALDKAVEVLDRERAAAQTEGRRYGFDEPLPVFLRLMRMLTPQSYGARFQNRMAELFEWESVPASLDRGDIRDAAGDYHEIKVTFITPSNPGVNFVQLRPYQDIAGYHLFIVERDYNLVHLWLSKEAMAGEIAQMGAAAHGTKAAHAANTNQEFAIRFPWDRNHSITKRWLSSYEIPMP